MSLIHNETALFVTPSKAQNMCELARSKPDVYHAEYVRAYNHGCMQGYAILLKMRDGALLKMSERYAEGLLT